MYNMHNEHSVGLDQLKVVKADPGSEALKNQTRATQRANTEGPTLS